MTSATQGNIAIRASGLTRRFGEFVAVDGIDLAVEHGELFSLLGTNGAGKTTTIKMLSCLLRPSGGSATILGHDIDADPLAVKRVIAISPQETAIAAHLDAWENLRLMAGLHGIAKDRSHQRSEELLEIMALTGRAKEQARKYSGGMQRRLSIAMALISDPEVLFLDEPTIGLDPQSRRGMWEYIEGLKGDTTIVLTTHYLEEADALADRIGIIDAAEMVAHGTAEELKARFSGGPATVVEAERMTAEGIEALRRLYPDVRAIERGVEIGADEVSVYDIADCLRPLGIEINSTYQQQVSLDDVFLDLTGKQLRE